MAKYTKGYHEEIPDPTPVELPIGYKAPESLEQVIARMIQASDFRKAAEAHDVETFEESDDFDVAEDADFVSEHEMSQMQEESPRRFIEPEEPKEQPNPEGDSETEEQDKPASKSKKRQSRPSRVEPEGEEVPQT